MSLRAVFAGAAADIFAAFGDVPKTVLVRKMIESSYDTTTGEVETASDEFECQGFVVAYDQREVDGETVRTGDVQCILRQAEVDAQITVDDKLTIDERIYDVINIAKDPADALWILQLRSSDA